MTLSRRSRWCDKLGARAARQGWRELAAEHGTPLLVLDPYRGMRKWTWSARWAFR
ncbi:hypothetical protein BH09ACT7_BH09ACT7_47160 [soil metagenome]